MPGFIRLLAAATLGLALAAGPVAAQDIHINPVPPHIRPQWTPVPNAPGVFWAPNLPTDVFRHGSKYFFYWEGYLYRGSKPKGPWKSVTQVPAWFSEIDPSYFKTAKKAEGAPPGTPAPGPAEGVAPGTPVPLPGAIPPAPPPAPVPVPGPEEAPGTPATPTKPPPKVM